MLSDVAYAKINLALHVRARRADGYHLLETIFAFAEDGDRLAVRPHDALTLTVSGRFGAGLGGEDDLVLRAARMLRGAAGVTAGAAITLDKRLPVAAGLGGGSADAAATLRLLARLWRTEVALEPIAAALGADVPACLASRTVRGEGVGDALLPVDGGPLAGMPVLLANWGEPMPTGPVFSGWDGVDRGPLATGDVLAAALSGRNDLEAPATAILPAVADHLRWLADRAGTRLVRMSGSGATCFALFDDAGARDAAAAALHACRPDAWISATVLR